MSFAEDITKQAWERAGGQCECRQRTHSHFYMPCGKQLTWEMRGKTERGGWDTHHTDVSDGNMLANYQILCWGCHNKFS